MNLKDYKKIFKNKNNQLFSVILIIGVVLIFISGAGDSKKDEPQNTDEEARLEEILSDIQGAGNVSVMVTYYEPVKNTDNEKNKAKGAVITADGSSDPSIKSALSAAACAALDLPAHKVCVYIKK